MQLTRSLLVIAVAFFVILIGLLSIRYGSLVTTKSDDSPTVPVDSPPAEQPIKDHLQNWIEKV